MDVSDNFVGFIFPTASARIPPGYLACDGAAVSRSTYPVLFREIGITHGQGDGSTTFNVPDYRGRFLRGLDGSAGRDPDKASRTAPGTGGNSGNAIGSVQGHELNSHTHSQNAHSHTSPFTIGAGTATGPLTAGTFDYAVFGTVSSDNTTATNNNSGGNETRPININVNYLIKC